MFPSSHELQKSQRESFSLWVEMPQRSPSLAVKWLDRLHNRTALLKVCYHVPPLLHYKWCPGTGFSLSHCEVSIHVFVCIHIQAKYSNGTTVETFSNLIFCTLLPFPSAFTSLCVVDRKPCVHLFCVPRNYVYYQFMLELTGHVLYKVWKLDASSPLTDNRSVHTPMCACALLLCTWFLIN